MVKWRNLCLPKDYGGLGIIESRTMNESLLGKYGWRILKADDGDLCESFFEEEIYGKEILLTMFWEEWFQFFGKGS